MADTIVGVATALGEGGVAIVRLSGTDAPALFQRVFRPARHDPPYESHKLMYGHIVDGGETLDEAMGVVMFAPNSYTREDVCELHTHGGAAAAAMTMRLLTRLGARPAEAGEFTRRAFLNGRIDLMQAEAVMDVISAQSAAALKAAARQLEGGTSRFIAEAQKELIALLSGVEAYIDYPDEIDEADAITGLRTGLVALNTKLTEAADERKARIFREGLHVALCGRPNAGKSTLFNALLGEERAIVTAAPGTTRDVLEGAFALDGFEVKLFDTAGLRESEDEAERIGVARARDALKRADVALMLVDAAMEPCEEDRELLRAGAPCPCAVLLNKQDAGEALMPREAEALTQIRPILRISAVTGEGLDDVRAYLRGFLGAPSQQLLTNERHLALARQARELLAQALTGLDEGRPLELAAVDMHEALYTLGRATGECVDERLLDDIFARFCVGK